MVRKQEKPPEGLKQSDEEPGTGGPQRPLKDGPNGTKMQPVGGNVMIRGDVLPEKKG